MDGFGDQHGEQPQPGSEQGSSPNDKGTGRQTQPHGGAQQQQIQPGVTQLPIIRSN